MHVLPKGVYPLFKYLYKNIVIGTREIHTFEELTNLSTFNGLRKVVQRIHAHPNEKQGWKNYLVLRKELLNEYDAWKKTHKGEYKL